MSHDFWRQIVTLFSPYKNKIEAFFKYSNHSENNFKAPPSLWMQENCSTNVEYISLQTVFILIQIFWSLNCNMNGHHHKYFSMNITFYIYYVTMERESMISNVVRKSWNWNFANFRNMDLILPEATPGEVL